MKFLVKTRFKKESMPTLIRLKLSSPFLSLMRRSVTWLTETLSVIATRILRNMSPLLLLSPTLLLLSFERRTFPSFWNKPLFPTLRISEILPTSMTPMPFFRKYRTNIINAFLSLTAYILPSAMVPSSKDQIPETTFLALLLSLFATSTSSSFSFNKPSTTPYIS